MPTPADNYYNLVAEICTEGWDTAVASHLAEALNGAAWSAVRRRPRRMCRMLADAATEVENASAALGEAAGLATVDAARYFRLPRLVQKIGQTLVVSAVGKVGESQTAAVARCLRIVGVWICLPDRRFPQCCDCVEALAEEHTTQWIQDTLERQLTGLAEPVAPPR